VFDGLVFPLVLQPTDGFAANESASSLHKQISDDMTWISEQLLKVSFIF
jgi:hypothetical protein